MPSHNPLSSPALGTSLKDLARPCSDRLRPAQPSPPASGPPLAMTLSGGGFRATLAALGVARFLADAGLLANTRYVSSVSGGSVANGVLAKAWPSIRTAGYTAASVDDHVIDPIIDRVSTQSLKSHLIRNAWKTIGPKNRTGLLADAFDSWWLDKIKLDELDPEVRWIVNAANVNTGVRFGFERDVVGDYVTGHTPTIGRKVRLATAVSASAAVPGAFAKVKLSRKLKFPCAESGRPELLDGGVYDNTGLEALDSDRYKDVLTVTLNAGGVLTVGRVGGLPIVGDLMRSNSLLYRQSTALRTRWMVQRFQDYERGRTTGNPAGPHARRGVLFALASTIPSDDGGPFDKFAARYPERRTWENEDLAFVPTVFDQLDEQLCRALVYRGWWLTGASFARFHDDELPLPDLGDGPRVG